MNSSAIILAGGLSKRFGQDKGLVLLANKPLIKYVLGAVDQIVDEIVVVANSKAQADKFSKVLGSDVKIVIDYVDARGPLVGAATGFKVASGEYALLLPCDTPLISKEVLQLLLDLCINRNAVIPRWPNGYIEPLHASYHVKSALETAENALKEGRRDMRSIIEKMRGVRYVSTLVLQQLDAELKFFININTSSDLKKVEHMLKRLNSCSNV